MDYYTKLHYNYKEIVLQGIMCKTFGGFHEKAFYYNFVDDF